MCAASGDPALMPTQNGHPAPSALPANGQTTPDARVAAEVVFGYNIPQPHSWFVQVVGVMAWLVLLAPATSAVFFS